VSFFAPKVFVHVKILLLGNYQNDQQESMQRFASFMADELSQAGHEVRTARPIDHVGRLSPSDRGLGKWLGYIDKFAIFPVSLRAAIQWADVVHICDQANSIYTKYMMSTPHVVTCHDILAIRSALGELSQQQTGWTGKQLQALIVKGLRKAQHIVCVSEATRGDLLRLGGIAEDRVSLVYNSLSYSFSPMDVTEAICRLRRMGVNPDGPFLLHVGGNQWYKNRMGVLRIFLALKPVERGLKLIMVGKGWTSEMRNFVRENELANSISELIGVENEDLRALYSRATLLLFPSLQEGFGWPIIEAQACGCPVVTSKRAPMTEIGERSAIYCDPEDPRSGAEAVNSVFRNLPAMRISSLRNASRFGSAVTLQSYISVYHKVQRQFSSSPDLG
jgi:glycosyltransferase involved in cell wall biosynthesis